MINFKNIVFFFLLTLVLVPWLWFPPAPPSPAPAPYVCEWPQQPSDDRRHMTAHYLSIYNALLPPAKAHHFEPTLDAALDVYNAANTAEACLVTSVLQHLYLTQDPRPLRLLAVLGADASSVLSICRAMEQRANELQDYVLIAMDSWLGSRESWASGVHPYKAREALHAFTILPSRSRNIIPLHVPTRTSGLLYLKHLFKERKIKNDLDFIFINRGEEEDKDSALEMVNAAMDVLREGGILGGSYENGKGVMLTALREYVYRKGAETLVSQDIEETWALHSGGMIIGGVAVGGCCKMHMDFEMAKSLPEALSSKVLICGEKRVWMVQKKYQT